MILAASLHHFHDKLVLLHNVTKIVLVARFKQNHFFFFLISFQKCNIFTFSYFELNFIEKSIWESGFSNFGHRTVFTK